MILTTLFTIFHSPFTSTAQELPPITEQQLENLTDMEQNETEDDSYQQQLEYFKKHPLNLNEADENELKEIIFLSGLQIMNLVSYRKLLGKFVSIYELQAIPSWDIEMIKKILPYITVNNPVSFSEDIMKRLKLGDHSLLIRFSRSLEKADGFDHSVPGSKYAGSRERIFFRHRYQYKNLLQYGIAADKDPGEQFFKGVQKWGFDFYSFHLFAKKIGKIQALAIGDFTVNMGQGLIQWQSLAFKKSSDAMGIKRQSAVLRPYHSSGEFYFHRGAGITIRSGKFETTAFISLRKLSANFITDTLNNEDLISSFSNSGYHRTASEIDNRNNLRQFTIGGNLVYHAQPLHLSLNAVSCNFSSPVQKRDEPYNAYAISGKSWSNFSVDYSYTYRNFHFFGETAVDKNFNKAFLNGLLISVDPKIDLSFLQRTIAKEYQAVYGNAFTENVYPVNENGIYTGITIRPSAALKLDAYADLYKFPWLKFQVDVPGHGTDFLAQLSFIPNKQLEVLTRYRNETKQTNQPENTTITNYQVLIPRQSWRGQIVYKIERAITLVNRVEMVWYDKKNRTDAPLGMGVNAEEGFLVFFGCLYKPMMKPYAGNFRLQYFETDGYNSRIYAYENDVLYGNTIPPFFKKGFRYYINLNYDLRKELTLWLRWAQTIYHGETKPGNGIDEIDGNKRSEIKLQASWVF